jgi:hypothetical protein
MVTQTKDVSTDKPVEDPVSQARRHIAELEGYIVRQEAVAAKLSNDERHVASAAEAREILDTLKHTLALTRRHLALERPK